MKAYIFGAGAHGRVVLEILQTQPHLESIEFIDKDRRLFGTEINGIAVRGDLESLNDVEVNSSAAVIAVGQPLLRRQIVADTGRYHMAFLTAVHPTAVVSPSAQIGRGSMVGAMSVINTNASVGQHVIVNTGVIVEHDCVLADYATVSTGVKMGGGAFIGAGAFLGVGATLMPRVSIGAGAIVGAGALVTRDVSENVVVYGVPARIVKAVPDESRWL